MKFLLFLILLTGISFSGQLDLDLNDKNLNIKYSKSDPLDDPKLLVYEVSNDGTIIEKDFPIRKPLDLPIDPKKYYLFKIWTKNFTDDNLAKLWHKSPSQIFKGIYFSIGSTFLDTKFNIRRLSDLDSAEHYFKLEIENYPDNLAARIALSSLRLDKRAIEFDAYMESINNIFEEFYNPGNKYSELEVKSLVRALKSINKADIADKIEYSFITENPRSKYAQEVFTSKMAEAESPEEFEEMTLKFIEFFPDAESLHQVLSAYISSEMQGENFKQIISFMSQKNDLPSESYAYFANRLIEFNTSGKKQDSVILSFYDKALSTLDNEFVELKSHTETENFKQKSLEIQIAKANYLSFIDSTDKALFLYNEILNNIEDRVNPPFFENYITAIKDTSQKIQILERAITRNNFSEKLFEIGEELYGEDWESKKALWTSEAEKRRTKYLKYQLIDGEIIRGFLKKTDETFVDFENLRGKAQMYSFFATWCGPCESLVPALEKLQSDTESENYYLAAVSSWEISKSRWSDIYQFLDAVEPKYRILIDETNLLPQKFGITGLPTTIYVAKDGKISFIEQGINNSDEFVRSSIDKLNFLNK